MKLNRRQGTNLKIIYYLCPTIEFFNKNKTKMKKGIHPENYRLVAFKDMSNDHVFLCRSAISTKETIEVNAGRVDKFMSRYAKRYDKKNAAK